MLEISNIAVTLDEAQNHSDDQERFLQQKAARILRIKEDDIKSCMILKRSIDARKRPHIRLIYTVHICLKSKQQETKLLAHLEGHKKLKNIRQVNPYTYAFPELQPFLPDIAPVVIGAGAAGLFATLALAEAGLCPILLEQGDTLEKRQEKIDTFIHTQELDEQSNIQFGLGGAGTFSDGKLQTGTKNKAHRLILDTLVRAGAASDILYDAKPHVGSDVLPHVVEFICNQIKSLGGQIITRAKVFDIEIAHHEVKSVSYYLTQNDTTVQKRLEAERVIIACGHSAHDIFELLKQKNFVLEQKDFAMGVRIEHPQEQINEQRWGIKNPPQILGAAPYNLVAHTKDRSAFTFCMCPGGYVCAATSNRGHVVTNGASNHDRSQENANAGLLVNVTTQDFESDDPLAGMYLQQKYEQQAFECGGANYQAPAQLVKDFLNNTPSSQQGSVCPTYPLGVNWGTLDACLPEFIVQTLREALLLLDQKLHGFSRDDAVLTGIESRSSSAVRICRDKKNLHALGYKGIFPAGEGAGYAGGIMSAAADGIRCAEALIDSYYEYID